MAKVSKETATGRISLDGLDVWQEHFEGGYRSVRVPHGRRRPGPAVPRAPGGPLPVPRLGYVVAGSMTFRFADREETYQAGDAYYVPPGHTPVHHAGAEVVEFSPTDGLMETLSVVMDNLNAAGSAPAEAAR